MSSVLPSYQIRHLLKCVVLLCTIWNGTVLAAPPQLPPGYDTDKEKPYSGSYGHFTATSLRAVPSSNGYNLSYNVCNNDNNGLIYHWKGPNFGSGPGEPLEAGACVQASRDNICMVDLDSDAQFVFTQHNEHIPADAYVSDLTCYLFGNSPPNVLRDGFPRFLRHVLRKYIGLERNSVTPEILVSAFINRENESINYTFKWSMSSNSVAIAAKTFAGQNTDTVLSAIRSAGFNVTETELGEVLNSESKNYIGPDRVGSLVYVVSRNENSPQELSLKFPDGVNSIGTTFVTTIDGGGIAADFQITTFLKE